ncbi:exosortase A [Massilia sp. R2A-15]|uniref:exosortase A n=1 Tax=Massilia sp. R2A-15 TaxID=3064278 RepID=UPI0027327BDC|nr:exosortase A [Massilia sp. R2A-15]WLI88908.1 exosortase A [Massilia sp. R2A-15]
MNPPPSAVLPAQADTAGRTRFWLIALALLAPFALYFSTARSIVDIWNSSETFAHGYAILPICLWLIWRRRDNFAAYPPTPYWPALWLLAAAGAAWLLARMGEVQVVQQYAMVAMLPLIALAVLGRRLAGSLAFPLLFVLFAVPFGEIFIAPLISFTADFTVRAVQLSGIPVLRNGTRFDLPSGSWSVVEACSGVRYLISSITIGCLYAYLTYRSTARRLLFVATAVVVPVIANGLRAYMIVMIGHLSSMQLATGVDHLVYGWLFFGLVMFLMFWIGNYWREDQDTAPAQAAQAGATAPAPARGGAAAITVAVVATIALWPAFALYNDRASYNPKPVQLDQVAIGWAPAPAFSDWTPFYMTPDTSFSRAYQPQAGAPVALKVLYYRNQTKNKALISSLNRVTGYEDVWNEVSSTLRSESAGAQPLALRESVVHGPAGSLLVWHWMWIDGRTVTNNYVGKLRQAEARLLLRGDDGAQVFLAAPFSDKPEQARASLRAFLAQNGGAITAALAAAHGN